MIERDLPVSIGVDVCWHEGQIVVARQSGERLLVEYRWLGDDDALMRLLDLPISGNAAARVCSYAGVLWLAYRDGADVGHLRRLDTGDDVKLGPVFSQRPFAFGHGRVAWLVGSRQVLTLDLGDPVETAIETEFSFDIATGLSHIDVNGVAVTWEAMRRAADYAVGFHTSGPFLIGEAFDNSGLRGQIDGQDGRLILPWPEAHDPRLAAKDGQCAVVAWCSGNRPAKLALVSAADLQPIDAPQPDPEPQPEPEPEPIPMPVPDRFAEAADFLAPRLRHVAGDPAATSAATFAAVNALCVQLRQTDPRWFLLVKEPGQNNVRLRGVDVLLYQISATEAQVVDVVADGDGHDGPPRPAWELKDIRPIEQAREPFPEAEPPSEPGPPPVIPPGPSHVIDIGPQVSRLIAAAIASLPSRIDALERQIQALESALAERQGGSSRVALKTAHGTYLVAEPDGTVAADRRSVGAWETFDVEPQ